MGSVYRACGRLAVPRVLVADVPRCFLLSIHRFGTGDFISTTMKNEQFFEGLLHEPIASLKFSDEFKEVVSKAGYRTLAEMLTHKNPYKLLKHPGFGYRMLAEYFTFLVDNKMSNYLQPR